MAKVDAKDVNLILLCTSSPEDAFGGACLVRLSTSSSFLKPPPAHAPPPAPHTRLRRHPCPQVQAAIGASNAAAFDLTAACSGFVLGVVSAVQYIRGGGMKNVLVIGADALSRHVDWRDRGTCILFGDGCGAVLVQVRERRGIVVETPGVRAWQHARARPCPAWFSALAAAAQQRMHALARSG